MKIDRYTKFLLTLITMCLLYLCCRDLVAIPKVHAEEPVRVILVDDENNPVASTSGLTRGAPLVVEMDRR